MRPGCATASRARLCPRHTRGVRDRLASRAPDRPQALTADAGVSGRGGGALSPPSAEPGGPARRGWEPSCRRYWRRWSQGLHIPLQSTVRIVEHSENPVWSRAEANSPQFLSSKSISLFSVRTGEPVVDELLCNVRNSRMTMAPPPPRERPKYARRSRVTTSGLRRWPARRRSRRRRWRNARARRCVVQRSEWRRD